jgi:hypothetical protein
MTVMGNLIRNSNMTGSKRCAVPASEFPGSEVLRRAGLIFSRLVDWMRSCWRASPIARPRRLTLIERIPLGPRQALALVEADGIHLLVTVSPDGAPSFYPLLAGRSSSANFSLGRAKRIPGMCGIQQSRAGRRS